MRSSGVLTVFFLCLACYYAVRLYKTKEIPFLDDAVEGFTEVIGFKPAVVQKKLEKKEQILREEAKKEEVKSVAQAQDSVQVARVEVVEPKKVDLFASVATEEKKDDQVVVNDPSGQKASPRDLFGNVASDNDNNSVAEIKKDVEEVVVSVYKTQVLKNDGRVMLRLSMPVTVNGKAFPKGYVFEASTALYEGRYLVHATSLGVSCFNSRDARSGQDIQGYQKVKGEVVLSEGEQMKLYYSY